MKQAIDRNEKINFLQQVFTGQVKMGKTIQLNTFFDCLKYTSIPEGERGNKEVIVGDPIKSVLKEMAL